MQKARDWVLKDVQAAADDPNWSHCGSFLDTLAQTIVSGSEVGSSQTSNHRDNKSKTNDDASTAMQNRGQHRDKAPKAKKHSSSPRVPSSHRSSNPDQPSHPSVSVTSHMDPALSAAWSNAQRSRESDAQSSARKAGFPTWAGRTVFPHPPSRAAGSATAAQQFGRQVPTRYAAQSGVGMTIPGQTWAATEQQLSDEDQARLDMSDRSEPGIRVLLTT